ncbi:MAG: ribonuclease P protein component [Bacteroidales bacterium]|nr:ribonuclease P protein component [Bacteroidales bacterium]MBN2699190.1 ribonuclease P protein component [Bacteroidales bacterium]
MPGLTFNKKERLKSNRLINRVFREGFVVNVYPLRIVCLETKTAPFPASVAVSVPKKYLKKATDRNRVKRRIKEAYRLLKPEFYHRLKNAGKHLYLVIVYQSQKIEGFDAIQKQIKKGLNKITQC